MKSAENDMLDLVREENDTMSLCSINAGGEMFGIDTRKIREVLGERELQQVPLSPSFVAGVVPYRGEVLTAVNLQSLLGMDAESGGCCVLVMEDLEGDERFGLVVDSIGGVVTVSQQMLDSKKLEPPACGQLF